MKKPSATERDLRDVNEQLILTSLRAERLAEEANAARAAAAASEERFRSLVMTTAALVFAADAAGRIAVDGKTWRKFTGLKRVAAGALWTAAIHPDDRALVASSWERSVATSTSFEVQYRLRRPDLTYAWVSARAVPIPAHPPVREWIGMVTDITDRIRVEEAREHFIAILGHDLRNPVASISVAAQLLLEGGLGERRTMEALRRIERSTHRIDALVRDVLDFARGRLGHGIPVTRHPCDLGDICKDEVAELAQAHPLRTLLCELSGNLAGAWDRDRMEQVLSNLLGNAIEHGADPIRVVAHGEADVVILSVHNRGPAISAAIIPKLFEPFRRRGAGTRATGLGLGLYIVHEIVRAHGGDISIQSLDGEGTTFRIRFPRQTPSVAVIQAARPERPACGAQPEP